MEEDIASPLPRAPADGDMPATLATELPAPAVVRQAGRLGLYITRRWRQAQNDERAFPAIAAEALARCPMGQFDLSAFAAWAMTAEQLPPQVDVESNFGEPPFTLFTGEGFQVNLLFWLDGTTTIHQHMFSGAFQVLLGSSLHATFGFEGQTRINGRLRFGRLTYSGAELLEQGAVRLIASGDGLIHSLFHLDRPSLTLIVRTKVEDDARPQYDYLPPGIAVDATYQTRAFIKRVQLLRMLRKLDHSGFARAALLMLRGSSLENTVRMLCLPELLSGVPVREQLLSAGGGLGDHASWLLEAHEHCQRTHALQLWRRVLTDGDLRFFLGLLLNVPSRADILKLVRSRYQRPPADLIVGWIRQIASLQEGVTEVAPIIDRAVDEPTLALVHQALSASELPRSGTGALAGSAFFRTLLAA